MAVVVLAVVVAACSDGGGGEVAEEPVGGAPEACIGPPVSMAIGDDGAGNRPFAVTDAVARRVAILPGRMAFDPAGLSALQSQAGVTPLALYTLYVADFEIDREPLSEVGLVEVEPTTGQTVAALTIVPTDEAGLVEGSVVTDGDLGYETSAELRPLGLAVLRDEDRLGDQLDEVDEVEGQVTVLQLTDDAVCLEVDVTVRAVGQVVAALQGVVQAPVVRASDAFFVT